LVFRVGIICSWIFFAITSPYASSIIATTVFEIKSIAKVRMVWGAVLLTGFIFGISGVKPIPVILVVQALNGLILPLITAYLILIINDHELIPASFRHPNAYNVILILILGCVLLIGLNNIDKAVSSGFSLEQKDHFEWVLAATAISIAVFSIVLLKKR
jgi:hypothetical protein